MIKKRKYILVIDDQKEIQELVDVALYGSEYGVIKASGGYEGIQLARSLKPAAILLDIMMPEMDGFVTCQHLKTIPETQNIPIIYLTAKQTEKGAKIASSTGVAEYIMKPFSPNELLIHLRNTIK